MPFVIHTFNPYIFEYKRLHHYAPNIAIVSSKGAGKSTMIADILYHLRDIKNVVVMSATEEGNGFYSQFVHPLFIYNKFELGVIKNIVDVQEKRMKAYRQQGKDFKDYPEEGVCIIIDDCAWDASIFKSEEMEKIYLNGRHMNIVTIVSLQHLMKIPPVIRSNIDYMVVFKETRKNNIKNLFTHFFGVFKKMGDLEEVLKELTNDYGAVILDTNIQKTNVSSMVYSYKAKLGRRFRIRGEMWSEWNAMLRPERGGAEMPMDDEDVEDYKPVNSIIRGNRMQVEGFNYDSE